MSALGLAVILQYSPVRVLGLFVAGMGGAGGLCYAVTTPKGQRPLALPSKSQELPIPEGIELSTTPVEIASAEPLGVTEDRAAEIPEPLGVEEQPADFWREPDLEQADSPESEWNAIEAFGLNLG
jgi:hypothetical protein